MAPATKPSFLLEDYGVVVHPDDNVAVMKQAAAAGVCLQLQSGDVVVLQAEIAPGHRCAVRDIPSGTFVLQYGQPIGTSLGIKCGDAVTHANMKDDVPLVRDVLPGLSTPPPSYIPESQRGTFMGFRRPDGRVGTRNYILVVPTSMCASHEAAQISTIAEFTLHSREKFPNVDGVSAIPHNKGCGCQDGSPLDVLLRVLSNYADHPNVGGVVLLELGCEKTNLSVLETYLQRLGRSLAKPLVRIGVQQAGGTQGAIQAGLRAVGDMLPEVNRAARQRTSISELVLGVKCGGSDAFSGITANPSLGYAADLLVRSGGTVLITEVPEFCGAEHILARRAKDAATARAVYDAVDWYKAYAGKWGAQLGENPSPGNIKGGLLNITIKSLGAIAKAGTTRVEAVTDYGVPAQSRGLVVMQGPGYDQESTPGLVAAGATVVVFTTGRGSTIGNAIAPVIKLASNNEVFRRMAGDIDLSAGDVLEGTASISDVGRRVFEHIGEVAGGAIPAKAETLKHREFQVWSETAVSL
jgi:altronate hydrolase